jgi:hypothetical protein
MMGKIHQRRPPKNENISPTVLEFRVAMRTNFIYFLLVRMVLLISSRFRAGITPPQTKPGNTNTSTKNHSVSIRLIKRRNHPQQPGRSLRIHKTATLVGRDYVAMQFPTRGRKLREQSPCRVFSRSSASPSPHPKISMPHIPRSTTT